ncbi:CHAT domain-containing protein [Flavobacteriales bacterium]|nr:CHAT domain-containing protein [Flavobacteriales bacterium]
MKSLIIPFFIFSVVCFDVSAQKVPFDAEDHNLLLDSLLERREKVQQNLINISLPEYIVLSNNIAYIYQDLGQIEKSIELNKECLELTTQAILIEHERYGDDIEGNRNSVRSFLLEQSINSYNNLGQDYLLLQDYPKAIEFQQTCLEISEKFGNKSNKYADALQNLAVTYRFTRDFYKALELQWKAYEIKKEIYGEEHLEYAYCLQTLGDIYYDSYSYEFDQARVDTSADLFTDGYEYWSPLFISSLSYYNEALSIYEKNLGERYNVYDSYYHYLLGRLYFIINERESHGKLALAMRGIIVDEVQNPELNELFTKEYELSYSYCMKAYQLQKSIFKTYEKRFNTNLTTSRYNRLLLAHRMFFAFPSRFKSTNIKELYNILCFLKGRELSRNSSVTSNIYKSGNKELINLHANWISVNKRIASAYETTLEKRKSLGIEIDKLQDEADNLERQLVKRSTVFASIQRDYSFNDIISHLEYGELYIDIVSVPDYYAYVIQKGDTIPQLIYLGSASYFDSIYNNYSIYTSNPRNKVSVADISNGNTCYKDFFGNLEPYLADVSTIYFSPEGVYNKINPNVLYDAKSSSFLIDKYDIVHVSNVEDFVRQKKNIQLYERPDDLYAVLIGNPTFLLGEEEVVLATNEYQTRSINQDELDSLQRGTLVPLPGTQKEINLIFKNLKSKGWNVDTICGVNATETRVKSIESPKVLHIATHGFFYPDIKYVKENKFLSMDNKKAVDNPMNRSGLVFAGGQNTADGDILANDNGWLTSSEASLLNLRGTELVVLSACETGVGDVQNGKGIYGLQRAIRIAGAESIIMSMWSVNDKVTQELMTYFYDYWIDKNMSKKEAFNKAQQTIREKYKHPYYWGAFIMLGE